MFEQLFQKLYMQFYIDPKTNEILMYNERHAVKRPEGGETIPAAWDSFTVRRESDEQRTLHSETR